ncbi:heparinase II/III family protein [Vibrio sp. PID17_43]|uniref:heparinase II/III family protein n=1 Tax=Vibrio sp. PID17_43 TaxID=1583451 RepID=UPI000BFF9802|nr:heparinase II/III family protein [Vibrio sp. PID17_43]PHJ40210.1 heparinase [Vibrio sp. PID17_43]
MLNKLFIYFNTIKYLKLEQVFFRLWYRFKKINLKTTAYNVSCYNWVWKGPNVSEQTIFDNKTAIFLSARANLNSPEIWNDGSHSKLWLYNLHYFDDFNSRNHVEREELHFELINRWIAENPPAIGNGWEPYPLSLRIVNWVKWLSRKPITHQIHLNSLSIQAEALAQQLEFHILGNHIFANAKALIFVGCFLKSPYSEGHLLEGLRILKREISEQFLDDGAHFELSPMYHSIVLWDLLELLDLARVSGNTHLLEVLPTLKSTAANALTWLTNMTHPDGEISFFNDSAVSIAPTPTQVFDYALKLGLASAQNTSFLTIHRKSGYSRMTSGGFVCLFDHANIGPDYLPGHAHADSLSFELSVCEQRVFVNSGTSLYGTSKERQRQRGTSAHNTVVVDNQNSSEVWSGFRVARRAYAKLLDSGLTENGCFVKAYHDGYKRLPGKVQHTRRIDVDTNKVVVSDKLSGTFQSAQVHYHLHPDIEIEVQSSSLLLRLPNGESLTLDCNDKVLITESTWHPKFGESIPNKKLIFTLSSDQHDLLIIRNN